jgi:hypothetical protein
MRYETFALLALILPAACSQPAESASVSAVNASAATSADPLPIAMRERAIFAAG